MIKTEGAMLAGLQKTDQYVEERHVGKDKEGCNDYREHGRTRSNACRQ